MRRLPNELYGDDWLPEDNDEGSYSDDYDHDYDSELDYEKYDS